MRNWIYQVYRFLKNQANYIYESRSIVKFIVWNIGVINDQLKDNKSKADNNETPVGHHKIVEESVEYSKGSELEPIIEAVMNHRRLLI